MTACGCTKPQPSVPRRTKDNNSSSCAAPSRLTFLRAAAAAAVVAAAVLGSSTANAFCVAGHAKPESTAMSAAGCRWAGGAGACTSWHKRPHAQQAASSLGIGMMRVGVTSSVIETVVKGILNLALANPRQATVNCRINSSARELVRGHLEQAKVDG